MLILDTGCIHGQNCRQRIVRSGQEWKKTQFANIIRYRPSGTYYARLRVKGKLLRQSLKTDSLSVAKLRSADLEKTEHGAVERQQDATKGRMMFGDALAVYRAQTEARHRLKLSSKKYRLELLQMIVKSWSGIETRDVHQ
jgi:hypothetical protein